MGFSETKAVSRKKIRDSGQKEFKIYYHLLDSQERLVINSVGESVDQALKDVTNSVGDVLSPVFFISIEWFDNTKKKFEVIDLQPKAKLQYFRVMWRDLSSSQEPHYYIVLADTPHEAIVKTRKDICEQPAFNKILFKYISVDERMKNKQWREINRNQSPDIRINPKLYHPAKDEIWRYYDESEENYFQRYCKFVAEKFNDLNNSRIQEPRIVGDVSNIDTDDMLFSENGDFVGFKAPEPLQPPKVEYVRESVEVTIFRSIIDKVKRWFGSAAVKN